MIGQDDTLFQAVIRNDLAGCERALSRGGDINMAGPRNTTPLFIACREGNVDIVQLLVEAGVCDTNKAADNGTTPFYTACHHGHVDVVRLLVEAGVCDRNKATDDGVTPFYIACQTGHVDVVRLLVEAGVCDTNKAANSGTTPLRAALANGHDSCVELLLATRDINVNYGHDADGTSALLDACGHVMNSLRRVGSCDSTRTLVRLLASRRVSSQTLARTIKCLQQFWLSNTQLAEIEENGQTLTKEQEAVRLLLPVLRAQSSGERRWCGCCWALTPDRNLPMCTRCREYGYCCDADGESNGVCQKKHWKVGGHRAECAALVASSSSQGTAGEASSGGDVAGVAEGKRDEIDDETTVDTLGSGNGGGGRQKKKGGGKKGKKKKGRR